MTQSQDGRRVIVAPVTGPIGDRIQAWRQQHDPEQARRLPPHATLLYWANIDPSDEDALDRQIRHAFPHAIDVHLGEVAEFDNPDHTFYVHVSDTAALDAARTRLFDGTHLSFGDQRREWDWHVTCVRYGRKGDLDAIRTAAAGLTSNDTWTIDTVLWLELRDGVYREVRRWDLPMASKATGSGLAGV